MKHVPVGDRLRILAVFSLPVDASALNLRQERYELGAHHPAIGQQGLAIDLRVLQYGVTREALNRCWRRAMAGTSCIFRDTDWRRTWFWRRRTAQWTWCLRTNW